MSSVNINIPLGVMLGVVVVTSFNPAEAVRSVQNSFSQSQSADVSTSAVELVKSLEGFRANAYLDPVGVATIGWGTTRINGRPVRLGMRVTQAEAEKLLAADMKSSADAVKRLARVKLTPGQFGALTSFTYNCGEGTLAKSTLLKKLNAGDYQGAAQLFPLYNKGRNGRTYAGLTKRRLAEQKMFLVGK